MPTPQKASQATAAANQTKLTADNQRLLSQAKDKEREIKRLKDEIERLKKAHADKLKSSSEELN